MLLRHPGRLIQRLEHAVAAQLPFHIGHRALSGTPVLDLAEFWAGVGVGFPSQCGSDRSGLVIQQPTHDVAQKAGIVRRVQQTKCSCLEGVRPSHQHKAAFAIQPGNRDGE